MKSFRYLILIIFLVVFSCGDISSQESKDVLFQVSTIDALLDGVYEGEVTYGELKQHGDFGIGTFSDLDGEMIALRGRFYKIKADGKIYRVDESMKAPFASVTFFESDKHVVLEQPMNYDELMQYLDSLIPTENIFYAILIEGTFKYIKTRSVPKQEKPYPPISEVVKNQPIFEFNDVKGTLVGFRAPPYVKGVNVPGYHFHFIDEERTGGGHLLECQTADIKVMIDYTHEFMMVLPAGEDFYSSDLKKDKEEELKAVER